MATISSAIKLYDGVTGPLRTMHRAMTTVVDSFAAMQRASGKAVDTTAITEAQQALAVLGTQLDTVEENITGADRAQQSLNRHLSDAQAPAGALLDKVKKIAAAIGAAKLAKLAIQTSDLQTSTRARLGLLGGGSVDELERKIMASAQRSRAAYFDTASAIVTLGQNAGKVFGNNNNEIIAFMEQINKQFVIGGASASAQSAAMTQLSQAMAAGALRGDELNSVLENAPGIARAIESYMGIAEGSIKSYAEQGLITADVIKNAMFAAADETNAKFNDMPKTWAQIWTSMQNQAIAAFEPVLSRINSVLNSGKAEQVTQAVIGGLSVAADITVRVFDTLISIGSWAIDNWSILGPLIGTVAAMMAAYNTALLVHNARLAASNAITAISSTVESVRAARLAMTTGATFSATVAQYGFNAALLACPITWIVAGLALVIAAVYAVVAWINKTRDTTISATGVICGTLSAAGVTIYNEFIVPVQNGIASLVDFLFNAFDDPVAAVKLLFFDLCTIILDRMRLVAAGIETVINAIPGVEINISGKLDSLYNSVSNAAQNVKDKAGFEEHMVKWKTRSVVDAYNSGYSWGAGVEDKVKNLFNVGSFNSSFGSSSIDSAAYSSPIGDIADYTGSIADNTDKIKDSLELTEEDLRYLRDLAEMRWKKEFTTANINIDMTGMRNEITGGGDLDGWVEQLGDRLREELEMVADGVYE